MENISDTIKSKDYSNNSSKNLKNYSTIVKDNKIDKPNKAQADAIVDQALDLISDEKFRPFFFKTLYIIGPTNFYEAMDKARQVPDLKCRPCFFVKRLKQHRDSVEN